MTAATATVSAGEPGAGPVLTLVIDTEPEESARAQVVAIDHPRVYLEDEHFVVSTTAGLAVIIHHDCQPAIHGLEGDEAAAVLPLDPQDAIDLGEALIAAGRHTLALRRSRDS